MATEAGLTGEARAKVVYAELHEMLKRNAAEEIANRHARLRGNKPR